MIKAHKIRLNPTPEQERYLRMAVGTARFCYNWGLVRWKQQYAECQHPSALSLKAEFNAIKREQFPWVMEVTKCCSDSAFLNLGVTFSNFFRKKNAGYPSFKKKGKAKDRFSISNDKFSLLDHAVNISKLGWVNMAESLRFTGKVMSATVSRTADHWYISIAVQMAIPEPVATGNPVGIDLGVKTLAVVSDGREFANGKHLKQAVRKVKHLSRSLARKQKGSRNRLKAKVRLARAHERVARLRSDALHKMTTELTRTSTLIGIEDLNVRGMVKNHHLAQAVSDCAFGEIARQLGYKSLWYGSRVIVVDRFYPSSKLCHACGHKNTSLTLNQREWTCEKCGSVLQRDLNAACNLRDEAVRLAALPVMAMSASKTACGRDRKTRCPRRRQLAGSGEAGTDAGVLNCTPER